MVILLFGIWDDRVGLSYRMKFAGQILAAVIVVVFAGIRISSIPFLDDVLIPAWVSVPLTVMVIVGVTNAVNLSDGLDGLAGGLSLISFTGIAYLAYQVNEAVLVLLTVSVVGGLLGFLRFNTHPARIFMGDAGSQFLGHYLAVAAILLTDATRTAYSPLLTLFLWGVPLLDTVGVMIHRYAQGRSPFVGDRSHVHYRLLACGLTHGQAVTLIYGVHAIMVGCAYLLRWQPDGLLIAVYVVFAGGLYGLFMGMPHTITSAEADSSLITQRRAQGSPNPWAIGEAALTILYLAIPLYLLGSLLVPREIPSDAGVVAGALTIAVLASFFFPSVAPWAVRAALYIGSTSVLYYSDVFPRAVMAEILTTVNVGVALLAVLVILAIRLIGEERFQTTPLDYLIILFAGVLPFLPGMTVGDVPMGLLTAKLIVLFFAFELLLNIRSSAVGRLGVVSLVMLTGVMLRAWWP
ncbi:MAG: undecaprenyl/decaprenyl-phosphate alpha-N-acetylglucosaminyl 1-phosphate transferase [Nitrospira sp.]|nr:undecaprenyl/decaprenyl-phosphate alpha-N-acetylglucosaminyl 1-phosphate transferase [Nitrospira sp.]